MRINKLKYLNLINRQRGNSICSNQASTGYHRQQKR